MTGSREVSFHLNGETVVSDVPTDETLLETLRDSHQLTSVRGTCGIGICGTCTVLVDGLAASSCLLLTVMTQGKQITTAEGLLGPDGSPSEVQEAFLDRGAYQCSFCIPAMTLAVHAFLADGGESVEEAVEYLGGNLCRCGTYPQIREVVADLLEAEV